MSTQTCKMGRRSFLVTAGGGLTLGFFCAEISRVAELRAQTGPTSTQVNTWLNIGSNGTITLTIGSSEMGQGSFSGLAQILSEDLMVNYNAIQTVQGVPAAGAPAIGNSIGTFGSSVIQNNYWAMREAGATAREMLVQAAMNIVGDQTRANYTVANAVITYTPTGQTFPYSQVAAAAALLTPPANAPLIPDDQFQFIGTTVNRVDIPAKVNGTATFGIDVRLPNMVFAVIQHCPAFGGYLSGAAPATPAGMIAVVPTTVVAGTGRGTETTGMVNAVAMVGTNTYDAWQAALALKINWTVPASNSALSNATFISQAETALTKPNYYVAGGANTPPTTYTVEGNLAAANAAIAGAAKTYSAVYTLPYIAHNTMEPLSCTVNYVPGVSMDIYAPTQFAASVLALGNQLTGLPTSQINVHTTYLGGGLGRKIETDFVSQAIQVAMAVGRPVMLLWPREQCFLRDQYRPMAMVWSKAGLDKNGNILGWFYNNASASILAQRGYPFGATGDSQGYEGSQNLPYNFGARVTEYTTLASPIPVGFWRSVGESINTFAVESTIDQLAFLAGKDPYLYRLNLLTDPRWIGVLEAVATLCNWSAGPAAGHSRGIAIGAYANSIVAEVVDISLVSGNGYDGQPLLFTVNNVWIAMDCYLTVNPGQVQAQLIGGMVHGLNSALYGVQNFVQGVAQNPNFHNNRVIRGDEMPQVAVTLIPNPVQSTVNAQLGGAGELGVPTLAPALANAYFKASGKRILTLPFFPTATMNGIGTPGV
jgi:isoquinoline 1-oxidoreductase subunit beta